MQRTYQTRENQQPKQESFHCPIRTCKRKYKREAKVQQHVEKDHYLETRNRNSFRFDHQLRLQISKEAEKYLDILIKISVSDTLDDANIYIACRNLLPQVEGKVSDEEVKRMFVAQKVLMAKLFSPARPDGTCGTSYDWEKVMDDLELFFRMGIPYYDTNFCPTLPMDFLWHALMQNFELYKEVCAKSTGGIIPHCNHERTEEEDMKRHHYFVEVFRNQFARSPYAVPINRDNKNDVKTIFPALQAKYQQMITEEKQLTQDKIEKRRNEEIQREKFLSEFCEENGIEPRIVYYEYEAYYRQYYEMGCRGDQLRTLVERSKKFSDRTKLSSSC